METSYIILGVVAFIILVLLVLSGWFFFIIVSIEPKVIYAIALIILIGGGSVFLSFYLQQLTGINLLIFYIPVSYLLVLIFGYAYKYFEKGKRDQR